MKLLLVLAPLLLGCSGVSLPQPGPVVNCDDAEVHVVADAVVQHVNTHHMNGYKHTKNQVKDVKVQPTASGKMFYLEIDLLETKCPSVSPTPIELCAVRPLIEQAVKADCDFKVQKNEEIYTVLGSRCKSELESGENIRRICPNCPVIAPLNDTQVVHAADVSLHKYNGENSTAFYLLHEIGRGRIQYGISNSIEVEFVIAASNCTKDEANSGLFACVEETGNNAHYGACSGSVVKNQGAIDEDVVVQCTVYDPQPGNVAPQVPKAPPQTNVFQSSFVHNINFSNLGHHSSESNSAEHHLLAAHAKQNVKRSLTGEPVPPNVPTLPLCPGRKIHF